MWRKMQEKELSFSRLSDIYGFRIICATEADCYRILGVSIAVGKLFQAVLKIILANPNQMAIDPFIRLYLGVMENK